MISAMSSPLRISKVVGSKVADSRLWRAIVVLSSAGDVSERIWGKDALHTVLAADVDENSCS
jgi:hypothetical protein